MSMHQRIRPANGGFNLSTFQRTVIWKKTPGYLARSISSASAPRRPRPPGGRSTPVVKLAMTTSNLEAMASSLQPNSLQIASKTITKQFIRGSKNRVIIATSLRTTAAGSCRRDATQIGSATTQSVLAPSSFLLLVVRPGAPSSVLAPSSDARSP